METGAALVKTDIIRPLFGWKRADNTRRYRRAYVWVPRKNGKTELAAGIALLVLIGDAEEGGEVYTIASETDQARSARADPAGPRVSFWVGALAGPRLPQRPHRLPRSHHRLHR